jgi:NitT/TauT family transport system ATP-binding protein
MMPLTRNDPRSADVDAPDPAHTAAAREPLVHFDNVALAYDPSGANAVEDISIDISEQEFIAVVGPSGCGKSTFMKLCSGLRPPTQGVVTVAGRRVSGPVKIVGMAFQNATLLPWRTTLENVLLPLEIVQPYRSNFKREKSNYVLKAQELLRSVGLEGFENHFPWQLSGGMQQRASICRAVVHDPKLLLLDEPFAALDAFTREELWCVLRDLWMRQRFTVVLVTHDLREAAFLADTVYVMSKRPGRILVRREVDLPRPRDLDVTYTDRFVELVRDLREHISRIRTNKNA